MSKICFITKKKNLFGQNRSHSMKSVKKKFSPNLQKHRFWCFSSKRFISLRISVKGMRLIEKYGDVERFLNKNK